MRAGTHSPLLLSALELIMMHVAYVCEQYAVRCTWVTSRNVLFLVWYTEDHVSMSARVIE